MTKKLAIFASGEGTNAENIITYFENNKNIMVCLVITNNPNAGVITRAKKHGIPLLTVQKNDFRDEKTILKTLNHNGVDYLILSGYLRKIPKYLVNNYFKKIINIHPALLPKYGGKGMYGEKVHQAVVNSKEKESGITIHYVNEEYDKGDIIFQASCPVEPWDTPDSLAKKIHTLEYSHFPRVIEETIFSEIS